MDEDGSSFWDTFHDSIWRDWRSPLTIEARLNKIADKLDPALEWIEIEAPDGTTHKVRGPYDSKFGVTTIRGEER